MSAERVDLAVTTRVSPDWSHEYDASDGIVVEISAAASPEQRFAYWDNVCEEVEKLGDSLSETDRRFLNQSVSVSVVAG